MIGCRPGSLGLLHAGGCGEGRSRSRNSVRLRSTKPAIGGSSPSTRVPAPKAPASRKRFACSGWPVHGRPASTVCSWIIVSDRYSRSTAGHGLQGRRPPANSWEILIIQQATAQSFGRPSISSVRAEGPSRRTKAPLNPSEAAASRAAHRRQPRTPRPSFSNRTLEFASTRPQSVEASRSSVRSCMNSSH